MADTKVQGQVECWIVAKELPAAYGQRFTKRKLELSWGGFFEFDAVSADEKIVACISTSCCKTSGGKNAIGKFQKIKADALYLLHAKGAERLVLLFTDPGMLAHFERERGRGRFPPRTVIELRLVALEEGLAGSLLRAAQIASAEVSPQLSAPKRESSGLQGPRQQKDGNG